LNFDNKLLQTPDGLLAALLGHLLGEVVLSLFLGDLLGIISNLARLVLLLLWDILVSMLSER
jgi:hypothetical protein